MKQTIYLMRHGQTLFNKKKKVQGFCDSPLTETGIEQAKNAGKWFKDNGLNFDKAYTSTLERTSSTLEKAIPGLEYERLKEIKEWNCGEVEGEDEEHYTPKQFPYNDYYKQFNGETQLEFQSRIVNAMNQIVEQDTSNNILVVSHGLVLKVFGDYCLKDSPIDKINGVKNCSIFKFEYESNTKKWILMEIIDQK